ncbi:DUF3618 domain-containing protein [Pseudaminobacter sp. 19-2017]|uniref:DUF3618 domain-containing protein n=1 Tax=Pseudaminobacter soli (ex Zhang et al. 2022) TaxID=2831468 RepID=A0A942DXS1_9HYPH|nr:DUF3618 domain-containing protein [Pseudaminobacter soli]MBS3647333.1 DUF3618 domain-containing protein [Pseudaminobacter soli]
MSTNGHKSSSEIERDVEQTRARVSETLDELRAKMSPGQMLDEVLGYTKDTGGGKVMHNLGRTMQDNPAPLLLIGAGIAWMMVGGARSGGFYPRGYDTHVRRGGNGSDGYRTGASEWSSDGSSDWGVGSASESVRDAGRSAGEGISSMASSAADMAAGVRESVMGAAASMRDTASSMQDSASRGMHDLRDSASRMGGTAVRQGRHMTESLTGMMREQPLLLGAIGLAIGAALGAALPETETEDRLMGEASDAVKKQASDMAAQGYDKAKAVAAGTYEKVAEEAEKQGLTSEKAEDLLGEIGSRASTVLQTAKETVKQEAKREGLTVGAGGEHSGGEPQRGGLAGRQASTSTGEPQRQAGSTGSQGLAGGGERHREGASRQSESASSLDVGNIETVRSHKT